MPGPTPPRHPARAKKVAAGNSRLYMASTPSQTAASVQGSSEAEISARSTKHAAWVAAGAALLAAVLALGGSWLSAERAAESARQTTITELSGETERSRAEFLREQQKDLYTEVITDLRQLDGVRAEYAAMAFDTRNKPVNLDEWSKRYDAPYHKFVDDRSSIMVIASEPAQQSFMTLMDAHKILRNN
jgi:hypothetical protein